MKSRKVSNKERIFDLAKLSITGLCKKTGINNWVLFGGGKIQKSARTDEFDVKILAVALKDRKLDREKSRNILVPLGALGLIKPRKTIINRRFGRLYQGEGYSKNEKMLLTIKDFANVPIVQGNIIAGKNTLKSLSSLKNAPYVELEVTCNSRLYKAYVSCFEVFRFYYGSSNGLLNACMMDDTAENLIFNPNAEKMIDNKPYVQLRKNLYDVDALPAARIRFDSYAKGQFEKIRSLTKKNPDNAQRWISCRPPIDQKNIAWKVSGRFLKSGAILITNIDSCNSTLPFNELVFGRDNDGRTDGTERKIRTQVKFRPEQDENEGNDDKGNSNEDGTKSIGGLESIDSPNGEIETAILDYSDQAGQFAGFVSIQVEKIEKVEVKTKEKLVTIYQEISMEEFAKLATSQPHGKKSDVQKASIVATKNYGEKPEDDDVIIRSISRALLSLPHTMGAELHSFKLKDLEYSSNQVLCYFPFNEKLDKDNRKSNEFELLAIQILKIKTGDQSAFRFAFIEFYNSGGLLEKRFCLMLDISAYHDDELDHLFRVELNRFRDDGRAWGLIKKESDDGTVVSEKCTFRCKLKHSTGKNSNEEVRLKVFNKIIKFQPDSKKYLLQQMKKDKDLLEGEKY